MAKDEWNWWETDETPPDDSSDARPAAKDSNGTPLVDGDSVILIKDLKVKGAGQTLKRGLVVKSIRLTADPEEIDCRTDGIKGLVLRTEFVKKTLRPAFGGRRAFLSGGHAERVRLRLRRSGAVEGIADGGIGFLSA